MWYQLNQILIDRAFGAMWVAWKKKSRMNLPANDPFRSWIMFNLGIWDTKKDVKKERKLKCEYNWNVNQGKKTLYTTVFVWTE